VQHAAVRKSSESRSLRSPPTIRENSNAKNRRNRRPRLMAQQHGCGPRFFLE